MSLKGTCCTYFTTCGNIKLQIPSPQDRTYHDNPDAEFRHNFDTEVRGLVLIAQMSISTMHEDP